MEENQHTEFKESWHDEYTRYISAFCNTEGGVLYIGIDDKGEVVGIEQPKKLIEKLPNFIAQKTGIMPLIHLREKAGKEYLEIEVQPSAMPISVHGRYYTRSGSVTSELQGNQLNMFLAAKMGLTWESVIEEDFSLEDIDTDTVERFKLLAKDRVPSIEQETDLLALMERLNLIVGGRFKRAAVVLFGKNVQRYVLQARIKIKVFKKEHGLTSNQFNYNSSLKTDNDKLYFGTLKGMISFQPNSIQEFSIQPKVYISQINYNDPDHNFLHQEAITFKKGITLEHNQSTFYIDYTSLSYQAPNLTQYAYCMEGLSSKWYHVVGENRVYFTKLPPGNYTFKVKAANLSGIWNDEPAMFQITILPPWWLSTKALILYGIIAIGCVVLLIFIISRHNKANIQQKIQEFENEKEKELYQAKIDFFINIAHEIRTPLTLIKSPLEKVTRDIKLSPSAKNYLTIVDKNANRLLDLVNQLLDFRKTEIEGYKLNFIHTDIIALMQETFERFHDTAEQEALQMIIECNVKSFYAFIDKEACTKILSNLLSNAIKYARSKIIVRFEAQDGERFTIDIMNDGKPISEEIKEKIFEPFYRDDSSIHKSGTGLGLPLARSLAEMHEGSLTLEESPAGLIIFRLRLPVNQPNSLKLEEEKAEVLTNPASERKYVTQESRPTVLVVEDNTEMLHFIGQEINVHYNVVTAGNGEEAIARLQEYGIQLIISDIMMPVMDGFTLLKKIKTNLEFSHIPIILLTAKNTLQSRMEGLELGADAYIDKPFSMDLLLTQVTNLLNNRSNMRAYYFNSPIANIKSMAYTKADEKFLKKLNDIIDSHINDVNLDVDMIADLMNLSRPTLYRKINGLSNVTPNELIKISRLKKATELILQGDMRIYEIAEAVGFNSQSYFSRAFSKQFNMSPSQYAKENNIELK